MIVKRSIEADRQKRDSLQDFRRRKSLCNQIPGKPNRNDPFTYTIICKASRNAAAVSYENMKHFGKVFNKILALPKQKGDEGTQRHRRMGQFFPTYTYKHRRSVDLGCLKLFVKVGVSLKYDGQGRGDSCQRSSWLHCPSARDEICTVRKMAACDCSHR